MRVKDLSIGSYSMKMLAADLLLLGLAFLLLLVLELVPVVHDDPHDSVHVAIVSLIVLHVRSPHKISKLVGKNHFFVLYLAIVQKLDVVLFTVRIAQLFQRYSSDKGVLLQAGLQKPLP